MDADGQRQHLIDRGRPSSGPALGTLTAWTAASVALAAIVAGCLLPSYEYSGDASAGGSGGGGSGGAAQGGSGPTGCPPADQALQYSGCGELSLSAEHCGACNRSCAGSQCVLGHCEKLGLLSRQTVNSVTVASAELLGVAAREDGLLWLDRAGTANTVPNTAGAYDVQYRASDGLVYWTNRDGSSSQEGVWRVAPGSMDGPELVASGNRPRQLVVDAEGAFFIDDSGHAISAYLDEEQGDEHVVLLIEEATDEIADLATDDSFVYWRRQDDTGASVDGVFRALKRTGKGMAEVPGIVAPHSLVVADGFLYVTLGGEHTPELDCIDYGSVVRVQVTTDGIGAPEVIAENEPCPGAIAVDADYVYWTIRELGPGGAIRRSPRHCQADPETVAFGLALPESLDVGSDAVFFVEDDLQDRHVTLATKRPDP